MSQPDYSTVGDAMADLIRANITGFAHVAYIAEIEDEWDANMPLCSIEPSRLDSSPRVGQNYIEDVTFTVEIYTISLGGRKEAVQQRDSLLASVRNLLASNSRFHADVNSTLLGDVDFAVEKLEEDKQFVAALSMNVVVQLYNDRS